MVRDPANSSRNWARLPLYAQVLLEECPDLSRSMPKTHSNLIVLPGTFKHVTNHLLRLKRFKHTSSNIPCLLGKYYDGIVGSETAVRLSDSPRRALGHFRQCEARSDAASGRR